MFLIEIGTQFVLQRSLPTNMTCTSGKFIRFWQNPRAKRRSQSIYCGWKLSEWALQAHLLTSGSWSPKTCENYTFLLRETLSKQNGSRHDSRQVPFPETFRN